MYILVEVQAESMFRLSLWQNVQSQSRMVNVIADVAVIATILVRMLPDFVMPHVAVMTIRYLQLQVALLLKTIVILTSVHAGFVHVS